METICCFSLVCVNVKWIFLRLGSENLTSSSSENLNMGKLHCCSQFMQLKNESGSTAVLNVVQSQLFLYSHYVWQENRRYFSWSRVFKSSLNSKQTETKTGQLTYLLSGCPDFSGGGSLWARPSGDAATRVLCNACDISLHKHHLMTSTVRISEWNGVTEGGYCGKQRGMKFM